MNKKEILTIVLPEGYKRKKNLRSEDSNTTNIYKKTEEAVCLIKVFPITKKESMPFGDKKIIIDSVHSFLEKNQGLIEADSGITNNKTKYVYSVLKTASKSKGTIYSLTMHVQIGKIYGCIVGTFSEEKTSERTSIIYSKYNSKYGLDKSLWEKDPYDKNFKMGCLMNQSENQKFDAEFPLHPLSELRKFLSFIIQTI